MEKALISKKIIIVLILSVLCLVLVNEISFLEEEGKRLEVLEKTLGVEIKKPSTNK